MPLLALLLLAHLCACADDAAELDLPNTRQPNLLVPAESGGKGSSRANDESEERKTLSQQVADGKYGLIQRELFANGGISAPGVISYASNSEVPRDNSDNLGGLGREEIWLAEDHLLVLRGGKFEPDDGSYPISAQVAPIDDYRAPLRQVKIPSKPKIPPPFPVQLADDGPIQILAPADPSDLHEPTSQAGSAQGAHSANAAAGGTKKPHAQRPGSENYTGGAVRGKHPLGPAQPLDEDDPSIYYPPPYSFYYPKDNSSAVPPGPLVPGIVLPPPPNFFGRLNPPTSTIMPPTKPYTTKKPTIPSSTTKKPYKSTTPKPYLPPVVYKTTTTPKPIKSTTPKPYLPPIIIATTTPLPPLISQSPKPVYVEYFETNKIQPPQRQQHHQVQQYHQVQQEVPQSQQVPQAPIRTYISSTAVPLRAFYKAQQRPAQIYYYDEDPSNNEVNTPKSQPPRIYITAVSRPQPKPQITLSNFEHHIQQLRNQLQYQQQRQQRYHQPKRYRQPRPVYQYSFGYDDRPRPTPQPPRYNVQVQPSVEYRRPHQEIPQIVTPSSIENYRRPITPSPIDYQRPQIVTSSPIINQEYQQQIPQIVTPNPLEYRRPDLSQIVTQSPIYNQGGYYKDDGYYEDVTKKYYTAFGQKLTTPLPPLLQNDLNVNYRRPLPPQNPQAEYFNEGVRAPTAEGGPGTFISYRLPGDGAHFYFLTPQLAQQQQRQRSDSENGYYYPTPQQRLRRRS